MLLSSKTDLDEKAIQLVWERLSMFLAKDVGEGPYVKFISIRENWVKYGGEGGRAFYHEDEEAIIFWAPSYLITRKLIKDNLSTKLKVSLQVHGSNYKYAIPISDIIHEMVHHVQFILGGWLYDDLLEASAEITSFLITESYVLRNKYPEYLKEQIALWYIGRKLLKLSLPQFYVFIRNCVVDPSFYKQYFSENSSFIKVLANEYSGSVEKLFIRMKTKLGKVTLYPEMSKDLQKLHRKIFHKRTI